MATEKNEAGNKNYQEIIKEINSNLTGDELKDRAYLKEQMYKYKDHENSLEIQRECGRLLSNTISAETQAAMGKALSGRVKSNSIPAEKPASKTEALSDRSIRRMIAHERLFPTEIDIQLPLDQVWKMNREDIIALYIKACYSSAICPPGINWDGTIPFELEACVWGSEMKKKIIQHFQEQGEDMRKIEQEARKICKMIMEKPRSS